MRFRVRVRVRFRVRLRVRFRVRVRVTAIESADVEELTSVIEAAAGEGEG